MTKTVKPIINLKNVGPIEKTSIELNKLTILTGYNSVGKSYIAYSVGLMYKNLKKDIVSAVLDQLSDEDAIDLIKQSTLNGNKVSCNMATFKELAQNTYKQALSQGDIVDKYKEYFAIPEDYFDAMTLEPEIWFSYESMNDDFISETKNELAEEKDGQLILTITQDLSEKINTQDDDYNDEEESIDELKIRKGVIRQFLLATTVYNILRNYSSHGVDIATTERAGAFLFEGDLDERKIGKIARNSGNSKKFKEKIEELIDLIKEEKELSDNIEKRQPLYNIPVGRNISFARQLKKISTKESYISKKNPEIISFFEDLMSGRFELNAENGSLEFIPNKNGLDGKPIKPLPFRMLSSSLRSIAFIYLYVKYRASEKELFIIDEPEAYLHPENQMKMARLIAMLINAGMRILVSTHSDFFTREFTQLILLNKINAKSDKTQTDLFYQTHDEYKESMAVNHEDINVYFVDKNNQVHDNEVDADGIYFDAIDEWTNNQADLLDIIEENL